MSASVDGSISRSLGGSQRASYFRKPACALGVLMTGYVEKMDPNAYIPKKRNRFLVATHQGLHWFKREKGVDLFGEERGSTTLSDITEADLLPGDDTAFYILLDEGGKRVFFAPTSEQAAKWVHCIRTAIRSRFLYRRETLSGLSFIHAVEGGEADGIVRPRLLLLTHTRKGGDGEEGGKEGGMEVVVSRHVEYEKGLPLPPLRGEDEVRVFLANGASVTMKGKHVLAAVTLGRNGEGEKGERKMRLPVRGGSGAGMAGAMLELNAFVMAVSDTEEGGKEGGPPEAVAAAAAATLPSSSSLSLKVLLPPLLQVEHAISLWCAVFLLLVLLTGDIPPSSSRELLQDRKACAMLSVASGLLLQVLHSLSNPRQKDGTAATATAATTATTATTTAATGAVRKGNATSGIYLKVEDYVPPQSVLGEEGREGERLLSPSTAVATPGTGGGGGGAAAAAAARGRGEGGGKGGGPPIPQRFIDGCLGDMVEANRRWNLTYAWRREFGTDEILDEPQPFFDLIKQCYPSWYCGQGKSGDPVYWERSGQVDQPRLKVAGCGIDELLRHYVMVTEFCWVKLYPDETKKTITVFDVGGVGIRDLAGDAFDFLRRSIHLISEHYPERSLVIMITNAPSWFAVLWKMIRPMVNERTQKKVKIVSKKETLECLKEFIDEADIPIEYGGKLRFGEGVDTARFKSPQELALREHVLAVNKKHGVDMVVDAKMKERDLAV